MSSSSSSSNSSNNYSNTISNEHILTLIFESISWDVDTLCRISAVSKKLKAVSDRLLWRQLCLHRAPRMIQKLTDNNRIGGGWPALAKLLFYCCGNAVESIPGHFIGSTRFSKTSGRSFLVRKCRGDLLYVTDPCEHKVEGKEYQLGVYRGVFKGFTKSKTRGLLNRRRLEDEERVRCPYCGARVWSMNAAQLVPKSAANRLGSHDGGAVEYFVCVNGHLYGTCWLVPLSSDENGPDDDSGPDEDGLSNLLLNNGSTDSFVI